MHYGGHLGIGGQADLKILKRISHCIGCAYVGRIRPPLIGLAHLMLNLNYFINFQDADGGHLGLRGQVDLKTLK